MLVRTLTVIACLLSLKPALTAQTALYFPPKTGNTWQTLSPASQHFCQDRIDSLYQFLETNNTKSFMLLKDGKIVLEKYFGTFVQDSLWYWASAGKSFTAFMVGQAQEEGLLNIQDKTSDYLGTGWTSAPSDKEALITIWHQLSMTSGLDDTFIPTPTEPDPNTCTNPQCLNYLADAGTRWAYHTGAYRLLHNVLASASGSTINQFTKSHVLDRTGMKGLWLFDVFYSTTRDMARFGLLTLAKGAWDTDTLLHDQDYFYDMTHSSQDYNKSYGYLWWLNGQSSFMVPAFQFVFPGELLPNAPDDMIAALGKNDQKIHIVPSKGWVVVRMGNAAGTGNEVVPISFDNTMWAYLNQLECNASAVHDQLENELKIYPNPAKSGWQIESNGAIQKMQLFDIQGKFVKSIESEGQKSVWLSATDLPDGMYMLSCTSERGTTFQKLIKSN
ncbi:MAG: serine hydrolase [Saprospiraceae bacterium]|nr:serine hydrolase [Lewinellaceae bacterium]